MNILSGDSAYNEESEERSLLDSGLNIGIAALTTIFAGQIGLFGYVSETAQDFLYGDVTAPVEQEIGESSSSATDSVEGKHVKIRDKRLSKSIKKSTSRDRRVEEQESIRNKTEKANNPGKTIKGAVRELFEEPLEEESPQAYDALSEENRDLEEMVAGFSKWPERFGVDWKGIAGQFLRERGWRDIGSEERYKGAGEIAPVALEEVMNKAHRYLDEDQVEELKDLKHGENGNSDPVKELDYNQEFNIAVASGYMRILQETENYGEMDLDRLMEEPFIWDVDDDKFVFYLDSDADNGMMEEYWSDLPQLEEKADVERKDRSEMRQYIKESGMPLQQAQIGYCYGPGNYGERLGETNDTTLAEQSPYAWEGGKFTYRAMQISE
ncbi:MAG: hypothetical protein SVV03_00620 [Candidatus Nanohaloarchaea archaeon]|nr:hypothetical protein [Candidatus Nanohaloarchaea archaeon]